MDDYSRDALLDFLDYASEKGLMNPNTASSRKATAASMLSILEEAEVRDVRLLDVEDIYRRFANIHGRKYSPDSLRVYKSRLKNAIDDFVRYTGDPAAFKPATSGKGAKRQTAPKSDAANGTSTKMPPAVRTAVPEVYERNPTLQTISIPIPLRGTCVVTISGVPMDLTEQEAKRIANVIVALASSGSA